MAIAAHFCKAFFAKFSSKWNHYEFNNSFEQEIFDFLIRFYNLKRKYYKKILKNIEKPNFNVNRLNIKKNSEF